MTEAQRKAVCKIGSLVGSWTSVLKGIEEVKAFDVKEDFCTGTVTVYIMIGIPYDSGFEYTRSDCTIYIGTRGAGSYRRRNRRVNRRCETVNAHFEYTPSGLRNAFGASLTLKILEGMKDA